MTPSIVFADGHDRNPRTGATTTSTYVIDAIGNIPPIQSSAPSPTSDSPPRRRYCRIQRLLRGGNGDQYGRTVPDIPGGELNIKYNAFDMPKATSHADGDPRAKACNADELRVLKARPSGSTAITREEPVPEAADKFDAWSHRSQVPLIPRWSPEVAGIDRAELSGHNHRRRIARFLHDDLFGSPHVVTGDYGTLPSQQPV